MSPSHSHDPRPRTVVYVEQNERGWWRVRVIHPGGVPHTLLTVRTEDEADTAARGYAVLNDWTLVEGDES